jgi:hypothetical protein
VHHAPSRPTRGGRGFRGSGALRRAACIPFFPTSAALAPVRDPALGRHRPPRRVPREVLICEPASRSRPCCGAGIPVFHGCRARWCHTTVVG